MSLGAALPLRAEAAEAVTRFLDEEYFEPFRQQLLRYGMSEEAVAERACAVDIFIVGITTRLRLLRGGLGDTDALTRWIAANVQRLVDAP